MESNGKTVHFLYDEKGELLGMRVVSGGTVSEYSYVKNLQGDITALLDSNGEKAASYTYDSWGRCSMTSDSDLALATLNSFRYRGYFYGEETGFYYLKSRYYDPEIQRYLNADVFYYAGHDVKGYNMYNYCGNDPWNNADPMGSCYYNLNGMMTVKSQSYNLNGVMQYKSCDKERAFCRVNGSDYFPNKNHKVMEDRMNFNLFKVAVPSLTFNVLNRIGITEKWGLLYYGAPWESELDELAGVIRTNDNEPWPKIAYVIYNILKNNASLR